MKILFFSDAHGNQYTMRSLVKRLKMIDADLIVFGGDVFGYYYGQKEILSLLRDINCVCLLGNHDKYFMELRDGERDLESLIKKYGTTYGLCTEFISNDEIAFLKGLKRRYDLDVDGEHFTFVHGSLQDPLEGRIYPDTRVSDLSPYEGIDYVFYGHTHHKSIKRLENGTVLINPGSIGQQRDGRGCTYMIFETNSKNYYFEEIEYNREELVMEIKKHFETQEMEQKLIEVLYRDKRNMQ